MGTSIFVFIVAVVIGYLVISGQGKKYNLAEWKGTEWTLMVIIVIVAIIGAFALEPSSPRKERSDLEKENLQWSHEAYDYIHSGQAAKDMGY